MCGMCSFVMIWGRYIAESVQRGTSEWYSVSGKCRCQAPGLGIPTACGSSDARSDIVSYQVRICRLQQPDLHLNVVVVLQDAILALRRGHELCRIGAWRFKFKQVFSCSAQFADAMGGYTQPCQT